MTTAANLTAVEEVQKVQVRLFEQCMLHHDAPATNLVAHAKHLNHKLQQQSSSITFKKTSTLLGNTR
jgi:hypothetical protein